MGRKEEAKLIRHREINRLWMRRRRATLKKYRKYNTGHLWLRRDYWRLRNGYYSFQSFDQTKELIMIDNKLVESCLKTIAEEWPEKGVLIVISEITGQFAYSSNMPEVIVATQLNRIAEFIREKHEI